MLPNLGSTKVDKILSQFSQMLRNENYISEMLLPIIKVKEKTGKFAKYGKENLRVYTEQIFRGPGARARGVNYTASQGTYVCRERAMEKFVPDEFQNNQDKPYDAKRDATEILNDVIWNNQERALAVTMEDTAVLTQNTTLSGTSQWSDYVNSDPFDDIQTAITTVRTATGQRPNTIAFGRASFDKLKAHPDVREQVKYTNGGQLSDDAFRAFLKGFFNLKTVLVGDAVYDTVDEGQTASLGDIWGKHCWLLYVNQKPTLMKATFGATLVDVPKQVDVYREEAHLSDVVRVRNSFDQNVMDVTLAYLIKDAVA